jgi:hypothetical protein
MKWMEKLWKAEKNAENIKSCRLDSCHGRAVLSNVDTHAHDDGHDQKDGLAIATLESLKKERVLSLVCWLSSSFSREM